MCMHFIIHIPSEQPTNPLCCVLSSSQNGALTVRNVNGKRRKRLTFVWWIYCWRPIYEAFNQIFTQKCLQVYMTRCACVCHPMSNTFSTQLMIGLKSLVWSRHILLHVSDGTAMLHCFGIWWELKESLQVPRLVCLCFDCIRHQYCAHWCRLQQLPTVHPFGFAWKMFCVAYHHAVEH